jgi:hypothetical protein
MKSLLEYNMIFHKTLIERTQCEFNNNQGNRFVEFE